MRVRTGFWRLSSSSGQFLQCQNSSAVVCLGGEVAGSCALGHHGPLCQSCSSSRQHNEDGKCTDCPNTTGLALVTIAVLIGVGALYSMTWLIFTCPFSRLRWLSLILHRIANSMRSVGLACKMQIAIAFYQCITVLGSVFLITLPAEFDVAISVFDSLRFDWLRLIPGDCLGSFELRMILAAAVPLCAICALVVGHLIRGRMKGKSFLQSIYSSLHVCLFIIFFVTPAVNRRIFESHDCIPFEFDAHNKHYYMRTSLSTRCYTSDHARILTLSYALIVIWPVGSVLTFAGLALHGRKRLLHRTPDEYVRATSFLHRHFKPAFFYWASVELALRSLLTGWVLLIDASKSFHRLIVAVIASQAMLISILIVRPYRMMEDNAIAMAAAVLLVLVYTGASYVKVFEDITEVTGGSGAAEHVLGFSSSTGIVCVLGGLALIMLGILCASVFHILYSKQHMTFLRIRETGLLPELTLKQGLRWMLFISHVWSTAQDQAATIKRQLQCLLPFIPIFLDVDDLEDLASLERYIEQSASFNIFLSRGYFASTNCIRELNAALKYERRKFLVWEANEQRGGAPLPEMQSDCPQELSDQVFCASTRIIQWHRITAFQLVSLKAIAEEVLLASPKYKAKPSLPLVMPGGLLERTLYIPVGVKIIASTSNPGAMKIALELEEQFPGVGILKQEGVSAIPNPRMVHIHLDRRRLIQRLNFARKVRAQTEWNLMNVDSTYFLLYLNQDTFAHEDEGKLLASQLRAAKLAGLKMILVHEQDEHKGACDFSVLSRRTPPDLLKDGVYKHLAIPLMVNEYRDVSLALMAKKLGAHHSRTTALAQNSSTRCSNSGSWLRS